MLIKRHLRNLYKASSVMIYMQMNLNVLGIHYVGFSDFIKSMPIVEKYTQRATREFETRMLVHSWNAAG